MSSKVFVTGGSGLLGNNIVKELSKNYEVYYCFNQNKIKLPNARGIELDLKDFEKTKEALEKINPDLIFHCAALTNVDYCEENEDEAELINVKVTENLAKIANRLDSKFVYISTDAVYDGGYGNYSEEDKTTPVNIYAKTKLKGEKTVIENCPNHIVARTNLYGWSVSDKKSLVEWMIDKFEKKEDFSGFDDVIFNPVLVNNLAHILIEMCEKKLKGVYNIGSPDKHTKYGFGMKIAEVFGFSPEKFKPMSIKNVNFKAKRPYNTFLNTDKLKNLNLATSVLSVKEGLETMKDIKVKF